MYAGGLKAIIFLFAILSILGWLSIYFGYTQHFLTKVRIARIAGSEREIAEQEFYALDKAENILAGTIAKISTLGEGGIWVWSNQGLKFFRADENTQFSYYDICVAVGIPSEEFDINRNSRKISVDIKRWADWAKVGNFVQLVINTPKVNNDKSKLSAVNAYPLPLFLPMKLDRLCSS